MNKKRKIFILSFIFFFTSFIYPLAKLQADMTPQKAVKIEKFYTKGETLYLKGEYKRARKIFNKILKLSPEEKPAQEFLSEIDKKIAQERKGREKEVSER